MRIYKGENGVALTFDKNGSYRYPRIFRLSDGADIWKTYNRPYEGKIANAVAAFTDASKRGVPLEDVTDIRAAHANQVAFVKTLSGLFVAGERGFCVLA